MSVIFHFENYDEAGVSYAHIAFARAGETAEPLDKPLDRLGDSDGK